MLKKLLILSAILSLFACQAKTKRDDLEKEKTGSKDEIGQYQTVDNEQQASVFNRQVQEQIEQNQPQVEEIEVQDRVLFDYDSFALSDEAKIILDNQTAWLKSDTSIKVTIEGHCDERGTREYNIALGERRSNSIKNYLTNNGIEESRIKTISYGKERPAFIGSNEESFRKNRRGVTVVN